MAARGGGGGGAAKVGGSGGGARKAGVGIGRGSWQGTNPSVTGNAPPPAAAAAAAAATTSSSTVSSANNSRPASRGGPAPAPAPVMAAVNMPPSNKQQQQPSSTDSLANYLDLHVKLTLVPVGQQVPQRDVSGVLFAYDQPSSTVVLSTTDPASKQQQQRSYHLIKTSQIKQVTVLSTTPVDDPLSLPPPSALSSVSNQELAARVDRAVAEDQRKRARIGPKGVSPDGQAMFDALAKTLPVRWHDTSIIVMDEVMIMSPYGPADVKGNKPESVARVRKMVEGERQRRAVTSS